MRQHDIFDIFTEVNKLKTLVEGIKIRWKSVKKSDFTASFKNLQTMFRKAKRDTDDLKYLKNQVFGIIDGLADRPIEVKYLKQVRRQCIKTLSKMVAEWQKELDKTDKKKEEKHDKQWELVVQALKNKLEKNIDTDIETIQEQVVEEGSNTHQIEFWKEEDEAAFNEFRDTTSTTLLTAPKKIGRLKVPVIIPTYLSEKTVEKLEDNGYNIKRVFGYYYLIENMTVFGISNKTFEKYNFENNERALYQFIFDKVNKGKKTKLTAVGEYRKKLGFYYFLLVPRSLSDDFGCDEWDFNIKEEPKTKNTVTMVAEEPVKEGQLVVESETGGVKPLIDNNATMTPTNVATVEDLNILTVNKDEDTIVQ